MLVKTTGHQRMTGGEEILCYAQINAFYFNVQRFKI